MVQFSAMAALAINTASSTEALAIFDEKKVIAEISWRGQSDESEKLLPSLLHVLKKAKCKMNDISRIIIVSGPGPFSALRIGVTVANVLAYQYNIPLYAIDTPTLWRERISRTASASYTILLLHAGGKYVHRSGAGLKEKIGTMEEVLNFKSLKKKMIFFGDLTEAETADLKRLRRAALTPESALCTFGQTMLQMPQKLFEKMPMVAPQYWRPPNITKMSNF